MEAEGKEITSSQELGERLGISSAQIRKDLSQFGEFGKQGTGYSIKYLTGQLKRILRVNQTWEVALIGAGDLGRAVANYAGFVDRGFKVVAVYDNDPRKIGSKAGPFVVRDAAKLVQELRSQRIQVAMLAVPVDQAQAVTDKLGEAGVKAVLCYAPTSINTPRGMRVQYIDPVLHLQRMTYYI
jgi:redox-sensing transcriptional repressor